MCARTNMHADGSLKVKAFYIIGDLADAAGVTWFVMRRLLRNKEVPFTRSGRSTPISVADIRSRAPSIWNALVGMQTLRVQAAERHSATANGRSDDDDE